jgi:DNA polymerase I-like protein with 3'-5' exonuclease and polymerase domains
MSAFPTVTSVAVKLSNFHDHAPKIAHLVATTNLTGLDIETAQPRAHAGIKEFNVGKRLAFDTERTDLCGLSLYPKGWSEAYYFNVGHADVNERIPFEMIRPILDAKPSTGKWTIHNGPFEQTMLKKTVNFDVKDYICTLQMAVSAYGPDEYESHTFAHRDLGAISGLVAEMGRVSRARKDNFQVQELLSKIIGKESKAAHSWNGYVSDMAYGYGLKKAVKSFFEYDMVTYEQVLRGREHMGLLTTDEVVSYGCDDAIWCCRLYDRLLAYMLETNPTVVGTFFNQELPLVPLYAETWTHGVRINVPPVKAKQRELRTQFAAKARRLKAHVKSLLPFPDEPNAELISREDWYRKNYPRYRKSITEWAMSADSADDFDQAVQLSGSIPAAWFAELNGYKLKAKPINITHYMTARTLIYDLFRAESVIVDKGKVQSDGDARGRLREQMQREGKQAQADVLGVLGELGSIEQAEKLYITPYLKLLDPDTGKLYPVLDSKQSTRRMALSQPNAGQLAKRGDSVFVRGFFLADQPDHVVVSIDFVQVELVLIGDESGDPEFARCYSEIPFNDLHHIAAAGCLEVSEEEMTRLKLGLADVSPHLLVNPKGEPLPLDKAYKYWRVEVGKGSNFEFWYSGLLQNLATQLGWSREKMFEMSERYASKFAVANEWRQMTIAEAGINGFTQLRDGHRRVRFESTPRWANILRQKFLRYNDDDVMWFVEMIIRRLQRRSGNMIVNARIQGTNATLTKRSMLGIRRAFDTLGWTNNDARIMFPVHDEIVASVHRDRVTDYIKLARGIMMSHTDIVRNLKIDCSPSVGLTFQPWTPKCPTGQIELFECPKFDFIPSEFHDKRLPEQYWGTIVDHLFNVGA